MHISVVVPTRNHSLDLEKCLASIRKQSKKPFEKIVVTYPNSDAIKSAKKYNFRVVYDKKKTIGNAYAAGAKVSRGNIVLFIDDDAEAPKNLLIKIEKAFANNPDISVIGGDDIISKNSQTFQIAAYQTDLAARPKTSIN